MSILLPPLGVFFRVGFRRSFWINILLTLLGYLPGLIHSIWVIATLAARDNERRHLPETTDPRQSAL